MTEAPPIVSPDPDGYCKNPICRKEVPQKAHYCDRCSTATATVSFGLKAQGHIKEIEAILDEMRKDTESRYLWTDGVWKTIGKHIGWDGFTARDHYINYLSKK